MFFTPPHVDPAVAAALRAEATWQRARADAAKVAPNLAPAREAVAYEPVVFRTAEGGGLYPERLPGQLQGEHWLITLRDWTGVILQAIVFIALLALLLT